MNLFQEEFLLNFLFKSFSKPQIPEDLKQLGIKIKKYKQINFEDSLKDLFTEIVNEKSKFENFKEFEEEIKIMGFEKSSGICNIF